MSTDVNMELLRKKMVPHSDLCRARQMSLAVVLGRESGQAKRGRGEETEGVACFVDRNVLLRRSSDEESPTLSPRHVAARAVSSPDGWALHDAHLRLLDGASLKRKHDVQSPCLRFLCCDLSSGLYLVTTFVSSPRIVRLTLCLLLSDVCR